MGMGRDQSRRDDAVRRLDRLVHPPVEPGADVQDRVALDHYDPVPQEPVPLAVEGDDISRPNSSPPRLSHANHLLLWNKLAQPPRQGRRPDSTARRNSPLRAPASPTQSAFSRGEASEGGRAPPEL